MTEPTPATTDLSRYVSVYQRNWNHRWLTKDPASDQYRRHIHAVLLVGPTSPEGTMTLESLRQRGEDPKRLATDLVAAIDGMAKENGRD